MSKFSVEFTFLYSCKAVLYISDTLVLSMETVSKVLRCLKGFVFRISGVFETSIVSAESPAELSPEAFSTANVNPRAGGVTGQGTNVFSGISKSDSAIPPPPFVSSNRGTRKLVKIICMPLNILFR